MRPTDGILEVVCVCFFQAALRPTDVILEIVFLSGRSEADGCYFEDCVSFRPLLDQRMSFWRLWFFQTALRPADVILGVVFLSGRSEANIYYFGGCVSFRPF